MNNLYSDLYNFLGKGFFTRRSIGDNVSSIALSFFSFQSIFAELVFSESPDR